MAAITFSLPFLDENNDPCVGDESISELSSVNNNMASMNLSMIMDRYSSSMLSLDLCDSPRREASHGSTRRTLQLHDSQLTIQTAQTAQTMTDSEYSSSTVRCEDNKQDENDDHSDSTDSLLSISQHSLSEAYETDSLLGEGAFAKVYRATELKTGRTVAIKDIDTSVLDRKSMQDLKNEIAALRTLESGPSILRLFDAFRKSDNAYLVTELCRGGDLLDRVNDKEVYTEDEARVLCRKLFTALDYMHKKHIAHRDLKPENILLVDEDDDCSIRLADFGYAAEVTEEYGLDDLVGTTNYAAPEVLDPHSVGYDERADMWSAGVIVYILLGGYAPFDGPEYSVATQVCTGAYQFHSKFWSHISDEAKDMIEGLLEVNPAKRLTAEQALRCEWMNR